MKENPYDSPELFQAYSRMDRSIQGLEGAGEWHALRALMPDLRNRRVLDLGCGYGWHCAWAADQGAAEVVGVDLSQRMLEVARAKHRRPAVTYLRCAMEDISFPPARFDVVLSSLALHYTEDFPALAGKVWELLAEGGYFLFSAEHPVFTAAGSQDWHYDGQGNILHFPVDRYFEEGARQAVFLGETVTKYHRTLTAYLDGLLSRGFALRRFVEPTPPEDKMDLPGMRDELRRPMMMLVLAQKIDR